MDHLVADQTGRLAGMFKDALDYAKAQLFGLIPGVSNQEPEYYIRGVKKTDPEKSRTRYENEADLYPYSVIPPEFDLKNYQRKNRPFLPEAETFTNYLRRTAVSDIPENLLVRDNKGNIISVIGMEEPDESYAFPDRRGAEFFAP